MHTRVLTTADPEWDRYLARLPGADVYHTSAYHRAHEVNGDGTALAFVAEHREALFFHPFLLRDIPGTSYRDLETVYGYGDPLSSFGMSSEPWCLFSRFCQGERVVAEFLRMNPLTDNWTMPREYDMAQDRETVVLDLAGTEADLWQRYSPTARNKIRKAQKTGLTGEQRNDHSTWSLIRTCYEDTMDRNEASDYYYFRPEYWQALETGKSWCRVFTVRDRLFWGGAVSLLYGNRMHYHLAGMCENMPAGGMNLLLHEAALWGQRHGYRWLHLGGGRTNSPDDALLRFKASMSPYRRSFYVGKRIHNEPVYRQLCEEWKRQHPGQDGGGYFLLWRKP